MSVPRLFLIDAHALCYRAFFAIKELRNSKGQATNAVYGFVAALKKILREQKPRYLAVCFDMKGKTLRQEKYSQYKIQRPAMPEELIGQIDIIKEIVRAYHIPVLEREGYEADDIIATICRRVSRPGLDTVIVSDDKDMFQLVNENVRILNSRQEKILGAAESRDLLGFDPALMPDYLALAGDQSDNIPGVSGIGEVTAKNLIMEYGSLKNILSHLDMVKPERARQALIAQKDQAVLSHELALLEDNAPVNFELEDMAVGACDQKKLKDIFSEMEFRKFVAELDAETADNPPVIAVKKITVDAQLESFLKSASQQGFFAFKIGPGNVSTEIAPPQKIWLTADGSEVYELAVEQAPMVQRLFENPQILKVACDIKEELKRLPGFLNISSGQIFDIMLAGYLCSPSAGHYQLSALAWDMLKKTLREESLPAEDVKILTELYRPLADLLKERELEKLFVDLEMPLAFVLSDMERAGVCLDQRLLADLSAECGKNITALEKQIFRLAGEEFNLNSPKQLAIVLFEKLKLPPVKKTKTGYSTDESVLLKLAEDHDMPSKLLEYRQLAKLKSTYIDALPRLIDPSTGRVHTTFNQSGTETGRLSSSNPNLQNIPIRTDLGRRVRAAFIPSATDRAIVSADYSQIELRILAHMSGDENLKEAFEKGMDIHASTAAKIFDLPEKDVTGDMRNSAKRVNFGIIYGMSAFGLSKDLKISQAQAQDFIDRYFFKYPRVKCFMDEEILKCRRQGYVTTLLNRRRYIPEINSPNIGIRQFAERQAINTPVQGSAADLIKLAMIRIARELKQQKFASQMIITVHDELVFDAVLPEQKKLIALIRECMENTMKLSVPVIVSVKTGLNWLETQKVL